jgi:hypothetical protein
MSRLRSTLVALLVGTTVLFAVGVIAERSVDTAEALDAARARNTPNSTAAPAGASRLSANTIGGTPRSSARTPRAGIAYRRTPRAAP